MPFKHQEFSRNDEALYDSFKLKNPLNSFRYPRHWEVDEEHDAYFVTFGGQGNRDPNEHEPPSFYALVYGGECVALEGHHTVVEVADGTSHEKARCKYVYKISRISIPVSLKNEMALVFEMIRLALLSQEKGVSRYPLELIDINFSEPIFV